MTPKDKKVTGLKAMVIARNQLLLEFFKSKGFETKVLGDTNQPIVIIEQGKSRIAISAHVKNFEYCFTDKPFHGVVTHQFNLYNKGSELTYDDLFNILTTNVQRDVYALEHPICKGLFFSYISYRTGSPRLYWSKDDPKYFVSLQKARKVIDELSNMYNEETTLYMYDNTIRYE